MHSIREHHRRQGQPTEMVRWTIVTPTITVQRAGSRWCLTIGHINGTSQGHYSNSLPVARRVAARIARAYAIELPEVASAIRMASLIAKSPFLLRSARHAPTCSDLAYEGCACGEDLDEQTRSPA